MRAAGAVAVGLAGAVVGLLVTALVLDAMTGSDGEPWWRLVAWSVGVAAPLVVGLVLVLRRAGGVIGWILLGEAVAIGLTCFASAYALYGVSASPGAAGVSWAALYSEAAWPTLFAGPVALAFVFPDGRLLSRRWRRVAIGVAVVVALTVLVGVMRTEPFDAPFAAVPRPVPALFSSGVWDVLSMVSILALLGSLLAGVLAMRTRYRRASGMERLQLKWLAYAVALIPLVVIVCYAQGLVFGSNDGLTEVVLVVMLVAIPAAVAIAVLRYRLYEIDRIINRTLAYAIVTGAVAAAFAAVAVPLGVALGQGSPWATAAATLAAVVVFKPALRYAQIGVDRQFNRLRYDGLRLVERFLEQVREGQAAPEEVALVLRKALDDPALDVLFWLPASEVYVDGGGSVVAETAVGLRACTPVSEHGRRVGLVWHNPALLERRDSLHSVVGAAGLAIEIARLRVELRRQLAEVEASRTRIVVAQDSERRRIERDLHDGAQQRLVSIGLALRGIQRRLPGGSDELSARLDVAVNELAHSISDLRELARGLRPAELDEGLSAALRDLAQRSPVPVAIEATLRPLPTPVETAAYFVAAEALTNAAKHAAASRIKVHAYHENDTLLIRVADDGVGGALRTEGGGLAGLGDRVDSHGGSLQIESPPGGGTIVLAEFPCAS